MAGASMEFNQLCARFSEMGVRRLLAKRLAPNDNSKNQPYLGGSTSILSVVPPVSIVASGGSRKGPGFKAALDFHWLDRDGNTCHAPGAQLILYPNYPEVRLSGFLRGCKIAPSDVMSVRTLGRVLLLGVTRTGRVYAYADFGDSDVGRAVHAIPGDPDEGVFFTIPVAGEGEAGESRQALLTELARIHDLGWIDSKRLRADGTLAECRSTNCGGYTLEAELGISANGYSAPDFMGWEIKSRTVKEFRLRRAGVVTLMTPEPQIGCYRDDGVEAFVRKYGYADQRGRSDRLNFGGQHKCGQRNTRTGLTLRLDGFDPKSRRITNSNGSVVLIDDSDRVAAGWDFPGLLNHWKRKHNKAAYVPCENRKNGVQRYRYSDGVDLGVGTTFTRLLGAIATGAVYYDPGIKVENASGPRPRTKRRSQFRVGARNLGTLYESWETVAVSA